MPPPPGQTSSPAASRRCYAWSLKRALPPVLRLPACSMEGALSCCTPPLFPLLLPPQLQVVIEDAGHFQFLDGRGGMLDAVCAYGAVPDEAVREVTMVGRLSYWILVWE